MKRILATIFVLTLLCSLAQAGLITVDVIATPGSGYTVTNGGKTVTVLEAGATINFQLGATFTTSSNPALNSLKTLYGGFEQTLASSYEVAGDFVAATPAANYVAPFANSTGAINNADLNGDGFKDLGQKSPTASGSTYWISGAPGQIAGSSFPNLGNFQLKDSHAVQANLGTGDFVIDSTVNYVKPVAAAGTYSFFIDGAVKSGLTVSGYNMVVAGAPVTIGHLTVVPEPSTLILLGMGCMALLAIRRRK